MDSPVYMESPSHDRNPSPPPEIREHGELVDAESIGSTAFSKHWLFSTLMKLIEEVDRENEDGRDLVVDVDEDLQNELCSLWDMSMNSEVSQFLEEFQAVEILTGIIDRSKAPRVTEICVGILGNMACEPTVCGRMSGNTRFIQLVLLLLEIRDTPTLVETTRLIYTSLSNTGSRGPWIKAVQRSEDTLSHLQFIFESSTNCDLLKNAADLVDTLLDLEGDICVSWATIDFIHALLEATEQIGSHHSGALEVYLHILQSFSTTEPGVEALVHHTMRLQRKLLKYLSLECEYEIVGIDQKEGHLTSALSVLNVIFSTQVVAGLTDDALTLYTDEQLMRIFLKILEPLCPMLENCKTAIQELANSNSAIRPLTEQQSDHVTSTDQSDTTADHVTTIDQSETRAEHVTATDQSETESDHVTSSDQSGSVADHLTPIDQSDNKSEIEKNGCQTSNKSGDKLERTDSRIEEEYRKFSILYEIVSGFLLDYCRFLFADIQSVDANAIDMMKESRADTTNGSNPVTAVANDSIPATDTSMESNSAAEVAKEDNSGLNNETNINNSNTLDEAKSNDEASSDHTEYLVHENGDKSEDTDAPKGDNSHICISVITYLDESCSRSRINHLALTLKNLSSQNGDKVVDSLLHLAERFGKQRLSRVLTDVCGGKIVKRAESAAMQDPNTL